MKLTILPLVALTLLTSGLRAENEVYRTWTDTQGRKIEATFRGIEGENIFLQVRNGFVHRLPLTKLSAADQEAAKSSNPKASASPPTPISPRPPHSSTSSSMVCSPKQAKAQSARQRRAVHPPRLSRHRRPHPHTGGSPRLHHRHQRFEAGQGHRPAPRLRRLPQPSFQLPSRHAPRGRRGAESTLLHLPGLVEGPDQRQHPVGQNGAQHDERRRQTARQRCHRLPPA
ncbi:MAG: hypothetical protein IPK32_11135 [Verrucomicrobiaceae bacterium]|nr:hypothetical protein [Verrucomicrobiaceae bacterium]